MFRSERTKHLGGVSLAVEAFGARADPPVVLVMGATSSMLWWPDGFCAALAARRRYVIRFDHRDTGRSTFWRPGAPGYTLADMAEDPIRIMDGLGLPAAHLVGMSMGGVLAQHTALRFPDRVLTLTAIASTPVGGERDLPGMSADYAAHAARASGLDWTDRTELAAFRAADAAALAGTAHPHDSAAVQRLIQQEFDRAPSVASAVNHFIVPAGDTEADKAEDLRLPLLVIHGTADPLFPPAHGAALAKAVPGARLVEIEGGGHELHPSDWPAMIAAIVAHTGAAPVAVAAEPKVR